MNNFHMRDMRNKRNRFHFGGFLPFHSITNYSSDATKIKLDMKNTFGDNLYIENLHLIPDPLKKNLADSFITGEEKTKTNMTSTEGNIKPNEKRDAPTRAEHRTESYPSLNIVTNFLSGVFSFVSGAMFQRRSDSSDYYECYDQNFDEMAPSLQAWQQAKPEDQNKNGRAHKTTVSTNELNNANSFNMNSNCGMNTADCEEKLNQVCFLFANQQPTQCQAGLCTANAQVFVEQSPTEDSFEDAFTHEDFECFPDDSYFEYYGPFGNQQSEQLVSDAPRNKTEYMPLTECMEITKTLPDIQNEIETYKEIELNKTSEKNSNVVLSCEDKINKLKLLLQDRRKVKTTNDSLKSPDIKESNNCKEQSEPILIPCNTKFESKTGINIKNNTKSPSSHTLCSEDIVKDIKEDFEGALSDSQSSTTSEYLNPCNYFDEVTGRFYSTSAESDDSFQIVFTDNPNLGRGRFPSECESEDSFIVFDETPDSCYSSNDIFGDELNVTGYDFIDTSESETSDSDSESDSGCDYKPTCKLSHTLSRTIGDLTDDSLYIEADEVDCAVLFVQETQVQNGQESIQSDDRMCDETKPRGLLIDERRKLEKKKQQCKTVRFSPNPPKVHVMRVWAFAARQARAGHWERHALDRERFKRRIADVEMAVSWVLKPQHRTRVMFQRVMPWWNAQKRKELAEKKKDAEVKETPIDKNVGINSEVVTETTNEANQLKKELDIDVKTIKTNGLNDIFEVSGTNNECMSHKYHNDEIALDVSKLNYLKLGIHGNNIDVST